MKTVIDQTQQIAEEELLLPLSDDELSSIAGGCPRPNPLDEEERKLRNTRCRPRPLDILQFGRKRASLRC